MSAPTSNTKFEIRRQHLLRSCFFLCPVILLLMVLLWRGYTVCGKDTCNHIYFDTQAQYLLSQDMLTPQEFQQIINSFNKLQTTLRTRWQGADLYAYGSIFSGLGTKTSDIDYYLKIPNYNKTADRYIVLETANLLYKEPERYKDIVLWLNVSVPMMSFYDIYLQRDSDLSFRSSSGIETTKLVAYYINLDKRYLPLTALIKRWCAQRNFTGRTVLPNYAIYLMVIFYLQQKNMVPLGHLIQMQASPAFVSGWNTNFKDISYTPENNESLYDLLGGFFKYYNEFNFTDYCVSGFVGRSILRKDLEDLNRIPEEFSMYKDYLKTNNKGLVLNTSMCVQDIFVHNNNVALRADDNLLKTFKYHINLAAKFYSELSCDKFLEVILSKE